MTNEQVMSAEDERRMYDEAEQRALDEIVVCETCHATTPRDTATKLAFSEKVRCPDCQAKYVDDQAKRKVQRERESTMLFAVMSAFKPKRVLTIDSGEYGYRACFTFLAPNGHSYTLSIEEGRSDGE